jgi:hypothetical protein
MVFKRVYDPVGCSNAGSNYSVAREMFVAGKLFRCLENASRLIICGYRFGDKGINAQIIDWVYTAVESDLFLVDPEEINKGRALQLNRDRVVVRL